MQEWYYVLNGQQQGPVSESDLIKLLRSEQLPSKTMVWMQDMAEWTKANQVEALKPKVDVQELVPPTPTTTEIFETPVISSASSEEEIFLHIPISRLIFMSIISCGLYEVYWIYKNWRYFKERDNLNIKPFWRAIFGVFFCHSLLKKIHQDKELNQFSNPTFSAEILATIWVVSRIALNIISQYSSKIGGAIDENSTAMVILLSFSFLLFVPVQKYINSANTKRNPDVPYTKWTTGHIVCVGIGLISWALTYMTITKQIVL